VDLSGKKIAALRQKLVNRIPLSRGLGSSSAAIVGGLVAANAGLGKFLSDDELLKLAVDEEGHPDNVAPALFGGLCVSALTKKGVAHLSWTEPALFASLRAVVCVPYFELSTKEAREALPDRVPLEDAVFNSSRVALFLSALRQGRRDLLGDAMEDRLHQPYRKKLVPGLDDVIAAARKTGAWGAALSGAGPSVLALSPVKHAAAVAEAMSAAFRRADVTSISIDLAVNRRGARVISLVRNKRGKRAS
jgi:homoserine kinase